MNPISRNSIPFQRTPQPGDEIKDLFKNRETERKGPDLPFKKEDLYTAPGKPTEPPRATFTSTEESLKRLAR